MHTYSYRTTILGGLAIVALLGVSPAFAVLEEVVVTATKRESTIQDVPLTIKAFQSEQIDFVELRNTRDLQFAVPGLVAGFGNGVNQVAIRGVGQNSTSGVDDPAVAQHIDGVYQTKTQAVLLALSDLERIEVLKGPQGTLYGRNANGGAINYVTAKPTDEFEGSLSATVGNFDRYSFKGHVSGPLTDTLSARASFYYNNQDGYVDVTGPGDDWRGDETVGGRLAVRFEPTDSLSIDLTGSIIDTDTIYGFQIGEVVNPLAFFYGLPGTFTTEVNGVVSDFADPEANIRTDNFTATISWDLSENVSIKSITGYQNFDHTASFDADYTASPFFSNPGNYEQDGDTITQEINITADLFDGRVSATGGFFYLDDDTTFIFDFLSFGIISNFEQKTEAWAVFGDVTVALTDRLRVIGGVRYNDEEKDVAQSNTLFCPVTQTPGNQWDDLSPKAGVQFDITDNIMVYGTWQEGFKAGGFDQNSCSDTYDPEDIESIEIGIKSTFMDGRAVVNASFFDYDYKDLQVTTLVGLAPQVTNAASSSITGVDLEIDFAVTDNFTLEFGGTFLDAEYDEFLLNDPYTPFMLEDLAGTQMLRAPDFSGTWAAEFSHNLGNMGGLTLRGEVYRSSKVLYGFFGRVSEQQDSYTTGNVYATFEPSAIDGLEIRGFVKNIGDKEIQTGALNVGVLGIKGTNHAIGTTFGASITKRF